MRLAALSFVALAACAERPSAPPAVPASTPPTVAPRDWEATANGCGDMFLHIADKSKLAFIVVTGKRTALNLKANGDVVTVDLLMEPPDRSRVSVHVDLFPRAGGDGTYCTDVLTNETPKPIEDWSAVRGRVTFTLVKLRSPHDFDVTLKLEGVVVKHPNGALEKLPDATYPTVKIGWLPG